MQCHDHIDFFLFPVIFNITFQKMQILIAIPVPETVTMLDHIFFQIKSDHIDIISF